MRVPRLNRSIAVFAAIATATGPTFAASPKLDKDTCTQFKAEQVKFVQSGILADLQRGPEWGKANLSAARLREIELFIQLDEQLKFGCREATLTPDLAKVEEIAKRLETDPNIDPFAPLPVPGTVPDPATTAAERAAARRQAQPNVPLSKTRLPQGGDDAEAAKPKPAAQPKPKPKPAAAKKPADDAYVGPPIVAADPPTSSALAP